MGETGADTERGCVGYNRSTDGQSYWSANASEHREQTTRRCCSRSVFAMAFPTRHRSSGEDSHRVCGPAKASVAQTNSAAASNSLSAIDSGRLWCGSDGHACKKESLT